VALTPGTRLGPYEITAQIGVGGMGEVYRATDTNLGRQVAIKVLPDAFAQDGERLARFEREARTLALLNHPNIAIIHGLEKANGIRALVMELVEGETLADRIGQDPIPIDKAVPIAKQIAEALEAAHEQGIIHRDLKPANIKVRPDGMVKVLDFGLAKAIEPPNAMSPHLSQSPTITTPALTQMGLILGTAAYMSPEQARGQPVDRRTDIWAFGCVLYEMLAGHAAFARNTVSDTLAAVLERDPQWRDLPASMPLPIRRVLRRCLEKDVTRRLHAVADARIEIEDALVTPSASSSAAEDPSALPRTSLAWDWRTVVIGVGALGLVSGVLAAWSWTGRPAAPPGGETVKFAIPLQPGEQFPIDTGLPVVLAISPDGDQVVYAARSVGGDRLYQRRLAELDASPIPGTEGAIGPFFSPDGQWIGFASGGVLKMVPTSGGTPRTVVDSPNLTGASWGPGDTIVYSNWNSGLMKVSARGGTPDALTTLDEQQGELQHTAPQLLPTGTAALFAVGRGAEQFVEAVELTTRRRRRLTEGRNPVYVPPGRILFARGNALFVVPFDVDRLEVTGEAVRVLEGIRTDGNDTHFAVAADGALAYVPDISRESRLAWFDRKGDSRPLDGERRLYSHPRLSPDGSRVVLMVQRESGGFEMWVYDAQRGTRARLTPAGSRPIWTAEGTHITFQRDRSLYSVTADDSSEPQLLLTRDERFSAVFPLAWSRNGRVLMFSAPTAATNRDVWMLPVGGTMTPFLVTPRDERAAMFSPDGRWVVYAARETGREEQIYLQPYPGPGGRVVISPGGGIEPVWSPTGREIFYRSADGTQMMSVDVRTEPMLTVGTPRTLFVGRFVSSDGSYWSNYDVSHDGEQFLMLEAQESSAPRLNVDLNWADTLK
jgi:eukaryotic-like serine/threonine-protein kinase